MKRSCPFLFVCVLWLCLSHYWVFLFVLVCQWFRAATHRITLHHTATLCNTLQHNASHCNTLQHTATQCNPLSSLWTTEEQPWPIFVYSLCVFAYTSSMARATSGPPNLMEGCGPWRQDPGPIRLSQFVAFKETEKERIENLQHTALQYAATDCSTLQHTAAATEECQCVAAWCIVMQRGAAWCSVVQCGAAWCSVVQCGAAWYSVVLCVAVCYSVLQCVAVCCSVLQCVVVLCSVLQCAAVCCSVLRKSERSMSIDIM